MSGVTGWHPDAANHRKVTMSARNLQSPPSADNGMSAEAANRQEVYALQKSSSDGVVASLSCYRGKLHIDGRPTSKGSVAPDLIDELETVLWLRTSIRILEGRADTQDPVRISPELAKLCARYLKRLLRGDR